MSINLSVAATLDEALDTYYQWDPQENRIGAKQGQLSNPGDCDSEYRYFRPRVDVRGLFSDHDKCRLLVLRGLVQDACHTGLGRYADDLRPLTVTDLLRAQPEG